MRYTSIVAILAIASTGAVRAATTGAEASLFQQYASVSSAYFNDLGGSDPSVFQTEYPKHLIEGINGNWAQINVLDTKTDDTKKIGQLCKLRPVSVVAKDSLAIRLVLNAGKDAEVTSVYSSMGGNVYGVATDGHEILHRLGFDYDGNPAAALNFVQHLNGVATIQKPSPDIMVIQINNEVPAIYGRCPTD